MSHDKEMLAKVKENTIKNRKTQKESGIKYEPWLIVKVSNFRILDTSRTIYITICTSELETLKYNIQK